MTRPFFIVLLLFSPCLGAASEAGWLEVRTPHFIVVTDASDKKGREVGLRLEQMRYVFGTLLQRNAVTLPVATETVLFRDRNEVAQYANTTKPEQDGGFVLRGREVDFIVLDGSSAQPYSPVLHGLALALLDANYPRTQPWFDEGFAQYFAAAQINDKEVTLGATPEGFEEIGRASCRERV